MSANLGPTSLNGARFSVCADRPATYDVDGFVALTYTALGNVKSFPRIGSKRAVTAWGSINGGATATVGSPNHGAGEVVVADVPSGAGLILVRAGEAAMTPMSIRVAFADNAIMYLAVAVSSFEYTFGDAGQAKEITFTINIQRRPVLSAATLDVIGEEATTGGIELESGETLVTETT